MTKIETCQIKRKEPERINPVGKLYDTFSLLSQLLMFHSAFSRWIKKRTNKKCVWQSGTWRRRGEEEEEVWNKNQVKSESLAKHVWKTQKTYFWIKPACWVSAAKIGSPREQKLDPDKKSPAGSFSLSVCVKKCDQVQFVFPFDFPNDLAFPFDYYEWFKSVRTQQQSG